MKKHKSRDKETTPVEKPAVKTTIVGGRPPGSGKENDSVPRGIEILVKKASVDSGFKEILLKERAAAAQRINLSLENSEITILNSIPHNNLEGMISATKVSPHAKQAFLGYTAAVMLAALTATTANAADDSIAAINDDLKPIYFETITARGIKPDIVEYDKTTTPYFRIAETDAELETGTLVVKVTDRMISPVKKIKIYFVKIDEHVAEEESRTEGLGYTNELGVYRIDGVPAGEYSVSVAKNSAYFLESREIKIVADTENLVSVQLQYKNTATEGIRFEPTGE